MFRTERKEEDMNHRLTRDQKQKAVELALQGGDYMAYLKKAGAKNPSAAWWYIKATLEKANPEKYKELMKVMEENRPVVEIAEKLPPEAVAEVPEEDPLEGFQTVTIKAGKTVQAGYDPGVPEGDETVMAVTELPKKPEKPKLDFTITEIQTDLGKFRRDSRDGLLYWMQKDGWHTGMTHADWMKLAEQLPQIIEVLGGAE